METSNQNQSNELDKTKKRFDSITAKLADLLGGANHLTPSKKVDGTALDKIVEELLKEEVEKNVTEVKEQFRALLKSFTQLKAELAAKTKELEKMETEKMKEFCKSADTLFTRIDGIKTMKDTYAEGLQAAVKGSQEEVAE